MRVGNDDHPVYVRQIRQRAHDGVCMYVDVDEFTRAHVGDEQPSPLPIQCGVVKPNWTATECYL
jgi:hypothetical protein